MAKDGPGNFAGNAVIEEPSQGLQVPYPLAGAVFAGRARPVDQTAKVGFRQRCSNVYRADAVELRNLIV